MKPGDKIYWDDPDHGIDSQNVTIIKISNDTVIVRSEGDMDFEVPIHELRLLPQPNEVWLTREGRKVLVVLHPMSEVGGSLGFVWWDSYDNTMNFSPLEDQLVEKTNLTILNWGMMMSELTEA